MGPIRRFFVSSSLVGVALLASPGLFLFAEPEPAAGAPATQPTTAPAVPLSASPTTQPEGRDSLFAELAKAVELAQQLIRTPAKKPAGKQPKNSVQAAEAGATTRAADPLDAIATSLQDKSGLIAIRVNDVFDNMHPPMFIGAPAAVANQGGRFAFLVTAECDNPTKPYLSPADRAQIPIMRNAGYANASERARDSAERARPLHQIYLFTDNPIVHDWARGSRHTLRATVLSARLERVPLREYAKATLVLSIGDEK